MAHAPTSDLTAAGSDAPPVRWWNRAWFVTLVLTGLAFPAILGIFRVADAMSFGSSIEVDFEENRDQFDDAVDWVDANTAPHEYHLELPPEHRDLAVNGAVSVQGTTVFFPMWLGIPDDAGGYVYAPDGDPYGIDLYGSTCQNIKDLGDDWWSCSMG